MDDDLPSFFRMKSFNVRVTLDKRDWVLSTCDVRSSIILGLVSYTTEPVVDSHVMFIHFLPDEACLRC